jgi:hypothetical protein
MKKSTRRITVVLLSAVMLAVLIGGCGTTAQPGNQNGERIPTLPPLDETGKITAAWSADFACSTIPDADSVTRAVLYVNGFEAEALPDPEAGDHKYIFHSGTNARVANLPDGYALTLPDADNLTVDFNISEYRSQFTAGDYILTVTREESAGYGTNEESWRRYVDEFFLFSIDHERYMRRNRLEMRESVDSTEILDGYTVLLRSVLIEDRPNIERPYYNIAVIVKNGDYSHFYLLVCKSGSDMSSAFAEMISGFSTFDNVGFARNVQVAYELVPNPNWNDATSRYFEAMRNQTHVSWGFFTAAMIETSRPYYSERRAQMQRTQSDLQEWFDVTFDIIPTYSPLGWGNLLLPTPLDMMREFGGGDGFNGKPVIQMTYHFETSRDRSMRVETPMFDILNGEHDELFREIARGYKEYGYPILFRLGNEMNGNWVQYNALATLLDPDIFSMAWSHLFNIFEEEGADNIIWVFNPNKETSHYRNYSRWMCYLPADMSQVHMKGLTAYEFGNGTTLQSFNSLYRAEYERSMPYFENFPWIIGEFAAGSGGERIRNWGAGENPWRETVLGRNQIEQAEWVQAMFRTLNNTQDINNQFARNIKIAIWFNGNDWGTDDEGNSFITNHLRIGESLPTTIEAFREGFAAR